MPGVSNSLGSLLQNSDPYSATGGINDKGQLVTTGMTGDHSSTDFSNESNDAMGKNDFLLLLTEQLKYQDPLNPMDNTKFVEQLAQFSELEAFTSVKESVDKMSESYESALKVQNMAATSQTNASAVGLVGKQVRLMQTTITNDGSGRPMLGKVNMGNRSEVKVEIFDDEGNTVQMLTVKKQPGKDYGTFNWNGKDQNGDKAQIGKYGMQVVGQDQDASLYCFVEDVVDGLRYTAEGPMLRVGGEEISVGNIIEVNDGEATDVKDGFSNLTVSQALGLVGMDVKVLDKDTTYKAEPGKSKTFKIDLNGETSATINITNGKGEVLKRIPVTGSGIVEQEIPFIDYDGSEFYFIDIESGSAKFVEELTIDSVSTKDGQVQLKAGGKVLKPSDLLEISAAA